MNGFVKKRKREYITPVRMMANAGRVRYGFTASQTTVRNLPRLVCGFPPASTLNRRQFGCELPAPREWQTPAVAALRSLPGILRPCRTIP